MYGLMLTSTSSALSDVGSTLTEVMGWIGSVLTALIGSSGSLSAIWPFVLIGFSISIIMLAIKVMRSFSWGI